MDPKSTNPTETGEQLLINLTTRVILHPETFKFCEDCKTIMSKNKPICRCGSYNHTEDTEAVKNAIKEVARGTPLMDLIDWLEKKK